MKFEKFKDWKTVRVRKHKDRKNMEKFGNDYSLEIVSGSRRVKEWVPAFARISKGPRNLSESLWDGRVVRKNLALTKACSPTVKFGAGNLFASAGP